MRLAPDTRLLIATECRMGRVSMVTVGPNTPRLNPTAHLVRQISVTAPDTSAKPILGVIGDFQRLFHGFKGRDGQHGPEDLFLENPHVVLAKQNGWFEVITFF